VDAASSVTGRPSTNTRVTFVFSSKRLLSVTMRLATLPFSIDPSRSAAPAMVAVGERDQREAQENASGRKTAIVEELQGPAFRPARDVQRLAVAGFVAD
jgi:hypothetical protein